MKLKSLLMAGAFGLAMISGAHAGQKGTAQILTCSGKLFKERLFIHSNCDVPRGQESYDLNLSSLSATERGRILQVCRIGNRCRVQVAAEDTSAQLDDAFDAVSLLHVTDRDLFSWER
jgi:hypothetical protein